MADEKEYFKSWDAAMILTRINLLKVIEEGNTDVIDTRHPIVRAVFPRGYMPDEELGHNIDAVRREGVRRGVLVPSA